MSVGKWHIAEDILACYPARWCWICRGKGMDLGRLHVTLAGAVGPVNPALLIPPVRPAPTAESLSLHMHLTLLPCFNYQLYYRRPEDICRQQVNTSAKSTMP